MKKVLFLILVLVFSVNLFAQQTSSQSLDLTEYGIRIEPDKRLIVILASLEAAGLKTPLSENGEVYRQKLQSDLQSVPTETRIRIKSFVDQYKKRHPSASDSDVVAPFISMAYSLSPVPDLIEPTNVNDLPGELLDVLDYTPLAREFYRRSNFSSNLDDYVKMYRESGDEMRGSAKIMVSELLDYMRTKPQLTYIEQVKTERSEGKKGKKKLRSIGFREHERRFFIVPELLAPKGAINFINIGDDYSAIVAPNTALQNSEVRRAYLQFIIDPLVLGNSKDIFEKSSDIKPILNGLRTANPNISPDVFLSVSRSLVAAVDARQYAFTNLQTATFEARRDKLQGVQVDGVKEKYKLTDELYLVNGRFVMPKVEDEVAVRLSEAYENGAVLAFYFAEKLEGLESSGFNIKSALNDMIVSLDVSKESNRLEEFAAARKRGLAKRGQGTTEVTVVRQVNVKDSLSDKLAAVEDIIKQENYPQASAILQQLLKDNPNEEPRVHYAIGSLNSAAAASAKDNEIRDQYLDSARKAYVNVLNSAERIEKNSGQVNKNSFAALKSQTYFALGRIYEFFGDEQALNIYDAAVQLGEIEGGAYAKALEAKARIMKEQ